MELNGLALGATLGIAGWTDWQQRKIYNKILGPAFLIAFTMQVVQKGWSGVWACLAGGGVGLALLLIPHLLGGVGAGDVKLLGVIGAYGGVHFVISSFLYGALLGGIASLYILIKHRALSAFFKHLLSLLPQPAFSGYKALSQDHRAACEEKIPYGIVLVAGTVATCFLPLVW
jgi:prepilin peptidase CpaA